MSLSTRSLLVVLALSLALVAGVSPATAQTADGQDGATSTELVRSCAAASPSDHSDPAGGTAETVGWVEGYWYDEPIEIDTSDGLDDGERDRLTARTAARVEALRCLTFEELPPVEVLTRSTYATETEREVADRADRVGQLKNAQYGTMLLLGPEADWGDVRASVLSAGVGAYYDPDAEQISMIVESGDDVPTEHVLAHELVHALQDQQFDLHRFDASQQSQRDAELGVIEGDARLVQTQYQERCARGEWSDRCVEPATQTVPELDANYGVVLLFEQPYLYGPAFVDRVYEDGGWDAVDDLYDAMPTHSSQVVASERDDAANVSLSTIEDRSTDDWERVGAAGRSDDVVVGQAALTTMLTAPDLEPGTNETVIDVTSLVDPQRRTPSNFDQPETSGWRGDRMHAYTDGESVATVWALEWATATDADQFADAYESLLEIRGAEAVDDREGTYVLDEASGYDVAVRVTTDGDRVEIVTAPTVDALSDVGGEEGSASADELPGFGLLAAIVAGVVTTLGTALTIRRRR